MESSQPQRRLVDGRYEVRAVLGGGASSIVYLAWQRSVQRNVAVKVLRREVFSNEREVDRYLQEAEIVAALNHPNIVTLFDIGRLPDRRPYMVMEYVAGQSLGRLLRDGNHLPIDTAFQVFEQVAMALGHAHRNGIVHRDVKPGNILLEHRSTGVPMIKVADFGVASRQSSAGAHPGAFIGTPMYMSPEQALGKPVTQRSDLYALGVLMFRTLTGVRPFMADNPVALALCHVTDPVPRFSDVAPEIEIPASLERVVRKCMEKDPDNRYPSAEALMTDLYEVRLRILPHLLGLSQESLDGLRPSRPKPLAPRVWGAVLVLLMVAIVGWMAFISGWGLSAWFRDLAYVVDTVRTLVHPLTV